MLVVLILIKIIIAPSHMHTHTHLIPSVSDPFQEISHHEGPQYLGGPNELYGAPLPVSQQCTGNTL